LPRTPAHRLLELIAGSEASRLFKRREVVPRRHVVNIIDRLKHLVVAGGSHCFALGLELVKFRRHAVQAAILGERLPIRDRLKLRQVHDFSARLRSPVSLGPGAGVKSRETPPATRPGRSMCVHGEF